MTRPNFSIESPSMISHRNSLKVSYPLKVIEDDSVNKIDLKSYYRDLK